MGCLGLHLGLNREQYNQIKSALDQGDEILLEYVLELEEVWDDEWIQQSDKAWDAIHRCLTNGLIEYGDSAFHKVILGSGRFYSEPDHIINILTPQEVVEVVHATREIDKTWMKKKYDAISDPDYAAFKQVETDFEYTWEYFIAIRSFFQKAAAAERSVVFTATQ